MQCIFTITLSYLLTLLEVPSTGKVFWQLQCGEILEDETASSESSSSKNATIKGQAAFLQQALKLESQQ